MLTLVKPETDTQSISLARANLICLLDRARQVVPTRYPKPILTCVNLKAADGWLYVKATDGDLALFTQTPVEGELPECVVPCGELIKRAKASKTPTCTLRLSDDGSQLIINGGRVEHSLQTLDAEEFPVVASGYLGDSVSVDAAELCGGLHVAACAVANDPSRYALDGILLESDDQGTRLVSTDGRRLVMVELQTVESEIFGQAILPSRMARLIEKFTDKQTDYLVLTVQRRTNEKKAPLPTRLFAAGPDWLLSTYEPDGRFPLFRDVVPHSHSKFAIDRKQLRETLTEVSLATNLESRMVQLDLGPQELLLSATAPGVGNSEAALPVEFLSGGDNQIRTAFNPAFLLDALKTLDSSTIILDIDQNSYSRDGSVFSKPALIYDRYNPVARWVLMPVNAGLEATRENLGSNYPEHMDEQQESTSDQPVSVPHHP